MGKRRDQCKENLIQAEEESRVFFDYIYLRRAVKEAEDVGMPPSELEHARELLKEDDRLLAIKAELQRAAKEPYRVRYISESEDLRETRRTNIKALKKAVAEGE